MTEEEVLFRGARVIDPVTGTDEVADVLVAGGLVEEVGNGLRSARAEVIDCDGLVLAPGLVDLHAHLREPGYEYKETIESGTRAAAAGGFTAVSSMANTDPVTDHAGNVAEIRDKAAEAGLADVTRLTINRDSRTTINLHAEANGRLDEDERDIDLEDLAGFDTRPFRSLVGSRQLARGSATVNRTILGDVSATLNGEVEHSEGRSGLGFEEVPLLRDSSSDSAHLGLVLNQDRGLWKYSLTGNADWARSVTLSDRDADTTDRARSTTTSGDLTGTFSGPIATLPAGRANLTAKLAVNTLDLDNSRRRAGITASNDLGRDRVRHGRAVGRLDEAHRCGRVRGGRRLALIVATGDEDERGCADRRR